MEKLPTNEAVLKDPKVLIGLYRAFADALEKNEEALASILDVAREQIQSKRHKATSSDPFAHTAEHMQAYLPAVAADERTKTALKTMFPDGQTLQPTPVAFIGAALGAGALLGGVIAGGYLLYCTVAQDAPAPGTSAPVPAGC